MITNREHYSEQIKSWDGTCGDTCPAHDVCTNHGKDKPDYWNCWNILEKWLDEEYKEKYPETINDTPNQQKVYDSQPHDTGTVIDTKA